MRQQIAELMTVEPPTQRACRTGVATAAERGLRAAVAHEVPHRVRDALLRALPINRRALLDEDDVEAHVDEHLADGRAGRAGADDGHVADVVGAVREVLPGEDHGATGEIEAELRAHHRVRAVAHRDERLEQRHRLAQRVRPRRGEPLERAAGAVSAAPDERVRPEEDDRRAQREPAPQRHEPEVRLEVLDAPACVALSGRRGDAASGMILIEEHPGEMPFGTRELHGRLIPQIIGQTNPTGS